MSALRTSIFAALLVAAGCKESADAPPNVRFDAGRRGRDCSVDDHSRADKAIPIQLDTLFRDDTFVCPPTDVDWFRFELPAGLPLVTVELGYPVGATSAVELAYDIFRAPEITMPVTGGRDDIPGDNRSSLVRTHSLGGAAGTYYIQVRDGGNDEQDAINRYGLKVSAVPDPDPAEPNNECASATALGPTGGGVIGANGDRDAYRFDIPSGSTIVEIHVDTDRASDVDLKASLFGPDGVTFLTTEVDPFGEDGPTALVMRYGFHSEGGSHCLIVEDDDGAESDPELNYAITVDVPGEIDPAEVNVRNDRPSGSIDLGGGGTRQGIIGSKADLDWYRVTARPGQIMEVEVTCPQCTIQPAIDLVYGHPTSPCGSEHACDFLLGATSCQTDGDCDSGICRDTPMGRQCADRCRSDLDCAGFECQQTGRISACVAIGTCTGENLCGVQQYAETAAADQILTAQLVVAETTYILVHDFSDDDFTSRPYTLRVTVVDDPDQNEPNNFYVPYTTFNAGDVLGRGRPMATTEAWQRQGGLTPRARVSGSGCISYAGDIDIFVLEGGNPCRIATSSVGTSSTSTTTGHCGLSLTYDRPTERLNLAYFVEDTRGRTRASFLAGDEGNETVFGDAICGAGNNECMFYYEGDTNRDYRLIVRDFGNDDWALEAGQCYTWTLTSEPDFGCPASCPTPHPNDGLCDCMP